MVNDFFFQVSGFDARIAKADITQLPLAEQRTRISTAFLIAAHVFDKLGPLLVSFGLIKIIEFVQIVFPHVDVSSMLNMINEPTVNEPTINMPYKKYKQMTPWQI